MTTSLQPWFIDVHPEGIMAILRDANANYVATFKDWQDAELVLEALQEQKLLKEKIDKLEDSIKDLETVNEDLRKELNDTP